MDISTIRMHKGDKIQTPAANMSQSSKFSNLVTVMRTQNRRPMTTSDIIVNVHVRPMIRGPMPRSFGFTGGGIESAIVRLFE